VVCIVFMTVNKQIEKGNYHSVLFGTYKKGLLKVYRLNVLTEKIELLKEVRI